MAALGRIYLFIAAEMIPIFLSLQNLSGLRALRGLQAVLIMIVVLGGAIGDGISDGSNSSGSGPNAGRRILCSCLATTTSIQMVEFNLPSQPWDSF